MLSLKLSFMRAKDRAILNIFTATLLAACQATYFVGLTVQCFYLRKKKSHLVIL